MLSNAVITQSYCFKERRRETAEQARKKRGSMNSMYVDTLGHIDSPGHIDLVKEFNEDDEERNHAGEVVSGLIRKILV